MATWPVRSNGAAVPNGTGSSEHATNHPTPTMAQNVTFTDSDEGKRVVDADGDEVGMISGVRGSTAYVDPDPGLGENIKSTLGWTDVGEEDYPLDESRVETVTDDEVRLKRIR